MNKKRFLPYLAIVASLVVGCNNQESKEKQEITQKRHLLKIQF